MHLVAERVGEPLHREPSVDLPAFEVQGAVDFDESHRSSVPGEHGEGGEAQGPAADGQRAGSGGRDRCGSVDPGVAKPAHDVRGFDARPHHDPDLGQLGADFGEPSAELLLGGVELPGPLEERVAAGEELLSRLGAERRAAVATG